MARLHIQIADSMGEFVNATSTVRIYHDGVEHLIGATALVCT